MKFNCKIEVSERDRDGNIVGECVEKDGDLFLDNFGWMLQNLFTPYPAPFVNPQYFAPHDTSDNAGGYVVFWTSTGAYYPMWVMYSGTGLEIGVGTGVTPPARTDYNLEAQQGSWSDPTPAVYLGNGKVRLSGSVFMPTTQNISEAALALTLYNYGAGTVVRRYLILHDTFTPVSVSGGNYAFITYTISF